MPHAVPIVFSSYERVACPFLDDDAPFELRADDNAPIEDEAGNITYEPLYRVFTRDGEIAGVRLAEPKGSEFPFIGLSGSYPNGLDAEFEGLKQRFLDAAYVKSSYGSTRTRYKATETPQGTLAFDEI